MKLNKSTTILLNIVLILVIVLLLTALIITPSVAYAKDTPEYMGIDNLNYMGAIEFTEHCNRFAKEGWRLYCINNYKAIFVR